MICPHCKNRNPIGNKFCRECGEKLTLPENSLAAEEAARVFGERQAEKCAALLTEAHIMANAKKFAAALALAEEAVAILPESTSALSLLATLYEQTEQEQKAIAAMEKVVALNPRSQADLIKLDQLKRGVHVLPYQGATPPKMETRLQKSAPLPWLPLALAGGVAVSVIGAGLFWLSRTNPSQTISRPAAVVRPAPTPPPSAANPTGVAPQYAAPVPMYGGPTVPAPPPPASQVRADPFAAIGNRPRAASASKPQTSPIERQSSAPNLPPRRPPIVRTAPPQETVAPVTIAPPPGVGLPPIGAGENAPPPNTGNDNSPFPPGTAGFGEGGRIPASPPQNGQNPDANGASSPNREGYINITIKGNGSRPNRDSGGSN